MNGAYVKAAWVISDHDGGHEIWREVSRCGSCGSLVLREDQDIHSKHHARLTEIAAMVSEALVEQGKITLNDSRRLIGLPEFGDASSPT